MPASDGTHAVAGRKSLKRKQREPVAEATIDDAAQPGVFIPISERVKRHRATAPSAPAKATSATAPTAAAKAVAGAVEALSQQAPDRRQAGKRPRGTCTMRVPKKASGAPEAGKGVGMARGKGEGRLAKRGFGCARERAYSERAKGCDAQPGSPRRHAKLAAVADDRVGLLFLP